MYRKLGRAASVVAITAASLGGAQAAQAATVDVPCSATALASAMSNAGAGDTLSLTTGCIYRQAALPAVSHDLTITGNGATLKDSGNLTVGLANLAATLTITGLNFRQTRIVMNPGGNAVITGGTFSGDTAVNGGAIEDNSLGGLSVTGATFTGNTATGAGGAIYDNGNLGAGITDCTFHGNKAGSGGAIADGSQFGAGISDSVISGNTAQEGGGIASSAEFGLFIGGSRITGNRAQVGGGIYNTWGSARITSTLIARNDASGDGGGIYYDGNALLFTPPVTLDGSTIARNSAGASGGGIYDSQWQLNATGTEITRNTAGTGGGGIYITGPSAAVTLATSPVTRNRPDNCEPADTVTGCIS